MLASGDFFGGGILHRRLSNHPWSTAENEAASPAAGALAAPKRSATDEPPVATLVAWSLLSLRTLGLWCHGHLALELTMSLEHQVGTKQAEACTGPEAVTK